MWILCNSVRHELQRWSRVRKSLPPALCFLLVAGVAAADAAPPRVVSWFPRPRISPESINVVLQATFSVPMDPATIDSTTFLLSPQTAGDVAYDAASRTAIFRPAADLLPQELYIATLTTGVLDTQGNPLPEAFRWVFETSQALDTAPPLVSAVMPETTALAVLNTAIQIRFSEDLDPATVTEQSIQLDGGATGTTLYHPPSQSLTFYPAQPLGADTLYTVTLSSEIGDSFGNRLSAPVTWQFQTGTELDSTPPFIVALDPPDGSHVGVIMPVGASATFSEAMDLSTLDAGTFFLTQGQSAPPNSAGIRYAAGTTVTVWAHVASGVVTQATMRGTVRDLAGNALGPDVSWSFTPLKIDDFDICETNPDFLGCDGGGGAGGCFVTSVGSLTASPGPSRAFARPQGRRDCGECHEE